MVIRRNAPVQRLTAPAFLPADGSPINCIAIWGHYHGGNLGDEVVVQALIQNIRRRLPDAQICGISLDPADTSVRYGIPAFSMITGAPVTSEATDKRNGGESIGRDGHAASPAVAGANASGMTEHYWDTHFTELAEVVIRRLHLRGIRTHVDFVRRVRRLLARIDVVLVAGSGPVYDGWEGPWQHPFHLFQWAEMCRFSRSSFAMLNVGAGPIERPLSRFFLRQALTSTTYRSFRDRSSADLVTSVGIRPPHRVLPDLAFSLRLEDLDLPSLPAISGSGLTIGLSTMAHEDPRYLPNGRKTRYQEYLDKLVAFARWAIASGHALQLLCSQTTADYRVAREVLDRLRGIPGTDVDGVVSMERICDARALLGQIARCNLVVGGRFHCHVLPYLLHKPVLGLAYHQKTRDLMAYMGQSRYCLDIDEASVEMIIERFQELMRNAETIRRSLPDRVAHCRQQLDAQYDHLFGPYSA